MKTLVTVDFDFFVPERPEWDFGHTESLLFLNMVWTTRGGFYDKMKTTGEEVGFWDKLWAQAKLGDTLWVTDSHCRAYGLTRGIDRVVLFDAHHDCWHGDSLGVDKTDHGIYCHNWLREWLGRSKKRRITWVKPCWQDACEIPADMKSKVDVVQWKDGLDLGIRGPTLAHVCRSGCWVPPWLDGAFLGFLRGFTGSLDSAVPLQDGDWNPLKERWTPEELASVLESEKKFRDYAVGIMSSQQFASSRVEVSCDSK